MGAGTAGGRLLDLLSPAMLVLVYLSSQCPSSCLGLGAGDPQPPALWCCLGCSLIQNSSKLTSPCGSSVDVTREHLRVLIPCGTFVFDLATRGSWNCFFFPVMLPNVKNKFSFHFLVRKSILCAAHPPCPAGETGLDSFGLMDVGCFGLTELLPLDVWVSQNCS